MCAPQLLEPGLARLCIGVERGNPLRIAARDTEIVGSGESEIGAGKPDLKPAVGKAQGIDGTVGRSVVDNDRLEIAKRLSCQCIDAGLQQRASIVIDDDHAHPGRTRLHP